MCGDGWVCGDGGGGGWVCGDGGGVGVDRSVGLGVDGCVGLGVGVGVDGCGVCVCLHNGGSRTCVCADLASRSRSEVRQPAGDTRSGLSIEKIE